MAMGIFSDRCEALVDKASGKALTGRDLEQARQDSAWPRCGNAVRKAARGCSKCGAPAPGGWAKCPKCGKWVGNESRFCWNCRTALHPEDRGTVSDGVWQKPAGTFAKRLDVGDIKALLHRGKIHVGEGALALLLRGGRYCDALKPGTHSMESLLERINHWGDPPPKTVVLLDAGDNVLPVRVEDLRSVEDMPVELYAEIHVRFAATDAAAKAFLANVMKDERELTCDDLIRRFTSEIRYAVLNICNTSRVEDLFKDPERRLRVEDELQRVVKRTEEEYGFHVVRVSAAEFSGLAYEKLREKSGEIEVTRRNAEFDQRLRELLQQDRMHQIETQQDMEEFVRQLALEKDISAMRRDQAIKLLTLVQRGELTKQEAEQKFALQAQVLRSELDLAAMRGAHGRSEKIADVKADVESERLHDQADLESTRMWSDLAAKEDERIEGLEDRRAARRLEVLQKSAAIFDGVKIETLLALVEAPERRKDLLEMSRIHAAEGRSTDEILAMAAAQSPSVAETLMKRAGLAKEEFDKVLDERRGMFREMREHDERMFNKASDTAADAARRSGGTSNIVYR
jgi:hypothetical protein